MMERARDKSRNIVREVSTLTCLSWIRGTWIRSTLHRGREAIPNGLHKHNVGANAWRKAHWDICGIIWSPLSLLKTRSTFSSCRTPCTRSSIFRLKCTHPSSQAPVSLSGSDLHRARSRRRITTLSRYHRIVQQARRGNLGHLVTATLMPEDGTELERVSCYSPLVTIAFTA